MKGRKKTKGGLREGGRGRTKKKKIRREKGS